MKYLSLVTLYLSTTHLFALQNSESQSTHTIDRPNIIWIMAEDMGRDLECYGMPGVQTPNLNKLAAEGALFTNAYASNPICSPNRSAMMVGADQTIINAHHHRSNRDVPLKEPYKPITYWLREAGYTCILGSEHALNYGRKTDCNFKHDKIGPYDGVTQFGLFDTFEAFSPDKQPFFNQIQLNVTHRGDWWNRIRKESTDPVSLDEIELPPYYADTPEIRYDWAAYLDTVEYMDNEVGQIMQSLKAQGLDKNTIVIFVADNGRCNIRGKGYLHEAGIHIPMIVWAPGLIDPGTVIDAMVSTTDVSATVLKLANTEFPEYITGIPFLGVEAPRNRDYVRSARDIWDEIDECSRSITTKRFKYIKNHMPEIPWVTDQAYLELNRPAIHLMRRLKSENKLSPLERIHFEDTKPNEELYDLDNDPYELNNLAENPEYAEVLAELRAKEADWQANHPDLGLADLGERQPAENLGSVLIREGVQNKAPELWKRLEAGELMETQAWRQYAAEPQE